MEFSTKAGTPDKFKSACAIVGIYADKKLTPSAGLIDAASGGALSKAIKRGDHTGKRASTLLLHGLTGIQAERVLLVGLGKRSELDARTFAEVLRAAYKALAATASEDAVMTLGEVAIAGRTLQQNVRSAVLAARESVYRFEQLKSKKEDPVSLRKVVFLAAGAGARSVAEGVANGIALADGVDLTKTLGNLPANICTPSYLADAARKIGREFKFKVDVLEQKQIEALRMGSFLSVTRGSPLPPKLIVLKYDGGSSKSAPVVLVGKGITFDTGGISLKPGEAMDEMKYDMCGAGTVLGTLRAVAALRLKINVIGIIATCENMPSGTATRPGDIVTSMSGQTVEILNTDAEGRLILCDALTYAERFKPAAVIDIATLTGACVIALGHINSGLFTPDDELATEILGAARNACDPTWRMPLEEAYQEGLKSNFADMANISGRAGSSITAACFLWRFTKKYRWAHLDIAGTAWKNGAEKGGTGRPVPLLTEFLQARAA
jgi:leucyl aminopeptidase